MKLVHLRRYGNEDFTNYDERGNESEGIGEP
jgi:hypothetical protein